MVFTCSTILIRSGDTFSDKGITCFHLVSTEVLFHDNFLF